LGFTNWSVILLHQLGPIKRVQMFRGFSARVMAAAHHLGIHGLNLPIVPEDDGSVMLFFS
jgi:hypothetical protein